MENKKSMGFSPFWIIIIILGVAVFKQIDFQNFNFKQPALGSLYLFTFIFSIFFMVKGKKPNKQ